VTCAALRAVVGSVAGHHPMEATEAVKVTVVGSVVLRLPIVAATVAAMEVATATLAPTTDHLHGGNRISIYDPKKLPRGGAPPLTR